MSEVSYRVITALRRHAPELIASLRDVQPTQEAVQIWAEQHRLNSAHLIGVLADMRRVWEEKPTMADALAYATMINVRIERDPDKAEVERVALEALPRRGESFRQWRSREAAIFQAAQALYPPSTPTIWEKWPALALDAERFVLRYVLEWSVDRVIAFYRQKQRRWLDPTTIDKGADRVARRLEYRGDKPTKRI